MDYKLKYKRLKKNRNYIFLEYEETPVYKYKLKTSVKYEPDDKNDFEKKIMIKDLEKIFNLKFTPLKLKDVKDKDNYMFYAEMSGSIKQKFWYIEFVTTKPLEKERLLYNDYKFKRGEKYGYLSFKYKSRKKRKRF